MSSVAARVAMYQTAGKSRLSFSNNCFSLTHTNTCLTFFVSVSSASKMKGEKPGTRKS